MNRRDGAGRLQWWILRAHWLLGIALIGLFTETSPWLLLAGAAAWTAGLWMDRAGSPRKAVSRIATPVLAVLVAGATADLLFFGRDLLSSISLLMLGIQSIRFLLPKGAREGWQLCAVSFLEFLVAAAVSDGLSLAFLAFVFLVVSAGAMWALHDQEAEELGRPSGGYRPSPGVAAWGLLLVGIAAFAGTAVLFAVVPRLEFRRGLQRFSRSQAVAGFSDAITFREVTGIKTDRTVVARVEFPSLDGMLAPGALYLRGAVYSRYSNGGWRRAKTPPSAVPRAGFQHLVPEAPAGPVEVADIVLEPADHPRLFTYGHPILIEAPFGPLRIDGDGTLSLDQPGHPTIRYRIRYVETPAPRRGASAVPDERYLEFPEGYEDVRALALEAGGGAGTAAARADRILRFFRDGFRYTLADPAPDLRRFLFDEKAGYCEHYAAGLALLLRGNGIPARVAAGYLGGEWNDLGKYLIVRQSDAHAWVEAWMDGRWVTLDATPPLGEGSPFYRKTGPLGLYVDWLRQRWDKYVVNYSLRMQADAVSAGWSGVRRTGRFLGLVRGFREAGTAARAAAILLVLSAAVFRLLSRRKRREAAGAAGGKVPRLPAPYERLLRRLEGSGFRASRGVPMEGIVAAAVRARPDLLEDAGLFLSLYHRDRFGPVPLPPAERAEAFRRANRLRKRLSG